MVVVASPFVPSLAITGAVAVCPAPRRGLNVWAARARPTSIRRGNDNRSKKTSSSDSDSVRGGVSKLRRRNESSALKRAREHLVFQTPSVDPRPEDAECRLPRATGSPAYRERRHPEYVRGVSAAGLAMVR